MSFNNEQNSGDNKDGASWELWQKAVNKNNVNSAGEPDSQSNFIKSDESDSLRPPAGQNGFSAQRNSVPQGQPHPGFYPPKNAEQSTSAQTRPQSYGGQHQAKQSYGGQHQAKQSYGGQPYGGQHQAPPRIPPYYVPPQQFSANPPPRQAGTAGYSYNQSYYRPQPAPPLGRFGYGEPPHSEFWAKQEMKKDVGYCSLFSMIVPLVLNVIAIIAVMFVAAIQMPVAGDETYGLGEYGFQILNGAIYFVAFLLCIIIIPLAFKRRANPFARYRLPSGERDDGKGPGLAAIIGALLVALALCIVANVVTSVLVAFMVEVGLPYPDFIDSTPSDFYGLLISVVFTAIFPAIFEEVIWRGYILRALRPYGDFFAVVLSAFLFGLMHGNIVQIPFAFMIGLICGWLVVKTNSIWLSVALHFLNNFMAIVLNYYSQKLASEEARNLMIFSLYGIIVAAGIIGLIVLLLAKTPLTSFRKSYNGFIKRGKVGVVFSSGGFWACVLVTLALVVTSIFLSEATEILKEYELSKEVISYIFQH